MSKIGEKSIKIPAQVKIEVGATQVEVVGPKGQLTSPLFRLIEVEIKDGEVRVSRKKDSKQAKSLHGLVRSLIANNIIGVTEGYQKTLKLVGIGYRVKKKGSGLELTVGFSHSVTVEAVKDVVFVLEGEDTIHISGIDKQKVGQAAADIRAIKPPEPYKGKGIRYEDEVVKLKPGKTAAE